MRVFSSLMAPHINRFLAHKRGLGCAYTREEGLLGELDAVAQGTTGGDAILTEALVRAFVARGPRATRCNRLTVAKQLARFLAVDEPRTFVPPRRFLGAERQKPAIRVLSREETRRFLGACDKLTDSVRCPHRRLIHGNLLRVLLFTGLRRGEALALKVADVDLVEGVLVVRKGKFGKSRFVPIAEDLAAQLRQYECEITAHIADRRADDAFFPRWDGHHAGLPLSIYTSFRTALAEARIVHGGRGAGPRLHDLRHTFAVLRLLAWYEQGADLSVKLPLLATYLGHVGLASSQVYLHMTLDLVGEVTRLYAGRFGDLITEVAS